MQFPIQSDRYVHQWTRVFNTDHKARLLVFRLNMACMLPAHMCMLPAHACMLPACACLLPACACMLSAHACVLVHVCFLLTHACNSCLVIPFLSSFLPYLQLLCLLGASLIHSLISLDWCVYALLSLHGFLNCFDVHTLILTTICALALKS